MMVQCIRSIGDTLSDFKKCSRSLLGIQVILSYRKFIIHLKCCCFLERERYLSCLLSCLISNFVYVFCAAESHHAQFDIGDIGERRAIIKPFLCNNHLSL